MIEPDQRHDDWTPARRARFLDCLGATGCVSTAAAHVGKSREGAYRLRRREAEFAAAWAAALVPTPLDEAELAAALDKAFSRAITDQVAKFRALAAGKTDTWLMRRLSRR